MNIPQKSKSVTPSKRNVTNVALEPCHSIGIFISDLADRSHTQKTKSMLLDFFMKYGETGRLSLNQRKTIYDIAFRNKMSIPDRFRSLALTDIEIDTIEMINKHILASVIAKTKSNKNRQAAKPRTSQQRNMQFSSLMPVKPKVGSHPGNESLDN